MSATGRPKKDAPHTIRHADDNYETPAWCVRAIWPHVRPISGTILEPCAGRGAIVEVLTELYDPRYVYACEIDRGRATQCANIERPPRWCVCADWLDGSGENIELAASRSSETSTDAEGIRFNNYSHPRLIITNPPYKLAQEFIERALQVTSPIGGEVAMLLRLNFLGSQKRGAWLVNHVPDLYVLSERPSFNGNGKTDATEYAWFCWGPKRSGRIHILPPALYGRESRGTLRRVTASLGGVGHGVAGHSCPEKE